MNLDFDIIEGVAGKVKIHHILRQSSAPFDVESPLLMDHNCIERSQKRTEEGTQRPKIGEI